MFVKALYSNFVDVEGFYFLRCFYAVCKASRRLFDILPEFYIFEKKKERDYLLKMIVDLIWLDMLDIWPRLYMANPKKTLCFQLKVIIYSLSLKMVSIKSAKDYFINSSLCTV